jgi:hypothetical protein
MQTVSSGTLIGWKSGQTTFVPLWDRMEGAWLRTQSSDVRINKDTELGEGKRCQFYTVEVYFLATNCKDFFMI